MHKLDDVIDKVVEIEAPFLKQHRASVGPIGYIEVVAKDHCPCRAARERRKMPGNRCYQQNLGVGRGFLPLEAEQAAKRFIEDDLLYNANRRAFDIHRLDTKLRFYVAPGYPLKTSQPALSSRFSGIHPNGFIG